MHWTQPLRAIGLRLRGRQATGPVAEAKSMARRFFIGIGGRPARLTVSTATPDALIEATEAGEHPTRKASGALKLRGLARLNGQLVALHEVDPMPAAERQPDDREAVNS